jgi:hypothetical protein
MATSLFLERRFLAVTMLPFWRGARSNKGGDVMAKSMNASGITDGQIRDVVAKLQSATEKHRTEISSKTFQKVLGVPNIGMELFSVLRQLAEKISKQVVMIVDGIDRSLSDAEAVRATGCNLYGNIDYTNNLPQAEGDSETVTFIPLEKDMTPDEVDALVADGGWKYASFKGLCKHNQNNPDFSKSTPHFTQGRVREGRHSYTAFFDLDDERNMLVYLDERDWRGRWFVAVVPASSEDLVT